MMLQHFLLSNKLLGMHLELDEYHKDHYLHQSKIIWYLIYVVTLYLSSLQVHTENVDMVEVGNSQSWFPAPFWPVVCLLLQPFYMVSRRATFH